LIRLSGFTTLVVLASLASASACRPSFQAVYEGDVHFEHCYAIDQRPLPVEQKKDCWRDWLGGYTYGQSNDRVEYAATRLSQLSLDPTLPTEDVRPARRERRLAAPLPTSVFAPPPIVSAAATAPLPGGEAPVDADAARPHVTLPAPGAACVTTCRERWNDCNGSCKDSACEACDKAYRACVPACFREGAPATGPVH
jgi:hypothetical protein